MENRTIYPASNSNQMTKEYYYAVREMMNSNATHLRATKVLRRNGSYEYFTYHLVTTV